MYTYIFFIEFSHSLWLLQLLARLTREVFRENVTRMLRDVDGHTLVAQDSQLLFGTAHNTLYHSTTLLKYRRKRRTERSSPRLIHGLRVLFSGTARPALWKAKASRRSSLRLAALSTFESYSTYIVYISIPRLR